jgi:hypothetical protein
MTQECGFKINHASLEFGALVHPERVKFRKLGPPVLAPQSSTFFSANKNAESHDARVLSACDADFEALFLRDTMASDIGQGSRDPLQTFEPPHECRGAAMAETVFDFF